MLIPLSFTLALPLLAQVRLGSKIPIANTMKTPQAVVIRAGKITVNNQKAPTSSVAAVDIQPSLKVLVIGSRQDTLTTRIVRKTANTLAEDGSEVTLLLPFSAPPSPYIANRVRTKEENYGLKSEALMNAWSSFGALDRIRSVKNFSHEMLTFCERVFERVDMVDWIRSQQFDIAVTSGATCFQPLLNMAGVHKSVILTTGEPSPWILQTMRIPISENPSAGDMSYFERAKSVIVNQIEGHILQRDLIRRIDDVGQRMFGERFTPFEEAVSQASFLLVNSDELLDYDRFLNSQWVYVGGLDTRKPSELNEQWSSLLSTRARNVIVSFGDVSSACERRADLLLQAFLEIPDTTFIWRDETGSFPNHTNIVFVHRLSESALLADSRVSSIATDGRTGLLYDTVAGGKPVMCIPSNIEQQGNCRTLKSHGMATTVGCSDLTTKHVKEMIKEGMTDRMQKSSIMLSNAIGSKIANRKEKLQRTVEFAAKHAVIPTIHSSDSETTVFQRYHIDIYGPIFLLLLVSLTLLTWIVKTILQRRRNRITKNSGNGGAGDKTPEQSEDAEKPKPVTADPLQDEKTFSKKSEDIEDNEKY